MAGEKKARFFQRLALKWSSWRHRATFSQVKTYCMFVGYPRSGHSLTGALLNAHPNIVIAHELDALDFAAQGYTRLEIFTLLLRRDQWFTRNGSQWYEFNYRVPGQFQGRFKNLKVIGDKKGGTSAAHLLENPALLAKLREVVQLPLRIIHITRNPFDNIATLARRRNWDIERAAEFYFQLAATNQRVIESTPPGEVITLRHEDIVLDPSKKLSELLHFLGVEATEKYLADCAVIVFETPRKSRLKATWSDQLKSWILAEMGKYPFLHGYDFDS